MTELVYGYIYIIIFPNDKKYIGQTTTSLKQRKCEHISCSRGKTPKYILHKAIKLYGEDLFEIKEIGNASNREELNSLEIYYIKEYNTYFKNGQGYNMTYGGEGSSGYTFTDEIKFNMSILKKEFLKTHPVYVTKFKEFMKEFWTDEQRLKMSILKKEQIKNNPEIIKKWRKSRGEWTEEEKEKQSIIKKEQFKNNPELAKNISERMTIFGNTLEGKKRGDPKPFHVYDKKTGVKIGTYDYVPFAVNDILNEKKLLIDISEESLGKSIRRVLSGERNHTKGYTFTYI